MNTKMTTKCYSELIMLPTFKERFEYLKLAGLVGEDTFGYERYLNQLFYCSKEWKSFRREMLIRDGGCDLGIEDREIFGRIEVHHINPIGIDDIERHSSLLLDPDNVICVSPRTHKAIHYGEDVLLEDSFVERKPNDMCPWRLQQ